MSHAGTRDERKRKQDQIDAICSSFHLRNTADLFVSNTTIECALAHGCVPCAYKIGCFDVALDKAFCGKVPNQRPEVCPRAQSIFEKKAEDGTLGFRKGMKVLTVGDGDFSFSLAISRMRCKVLATSYETRDTISAVYPHCHLKELKELGAEVRFGVDATQIGTTLPGKKFHRIVWNFPCTAVASGQDGQNEAMDANRNLVRNFVATARHLLEARGEIVMCHKTKPPFNQWKLEETALELVKDEPRIIFTGRVVLDRYLLPPYQPRKALDSKSFPCHDACFYIFQICGGDADDKVAVFPHTLSDCATEYDHSSPSRRSSRPPAVLYPVTSKLINIIRMQLLNGRVSAKPKYNAKPSRKRKRRRCG